MKPLDKLEVFKNRLNKIGIEITMVGNFPWIYLDTINNKVVTETYYSRHRFTLAFLNKEGTNVKFADISKVFNLIRRYTNKTKSNDNRNSR